VFNSATHTSSASSVSLLSSSFTSHQLTHICLWSTSFLYSYVLSDSIINLCILYYLI